MNRDPVPSAEDAACAQWATFFIGGELFALPVDDVQEVLRTQPLTPVPLAPDYVAGLLSLRGEILPVFDLRNLLGCPCDRPGKRLVVARLPGRPPVALIVDELGDVLELPARGWRPAPETVPPSQRALVLGTHTHDGQILIALRTAAVIGGAATDANDRPS